jgi:hypothetical protein
MAGYTKLHSGILDSSIWSADVYTRVVWVAMLAKADAEGRVMAAPSRMVEICNVPQSRFDRAIEKLSGPDPESKTPDHEGRRIAKIQGGWQILNYKKYRYELESEERKEYKRKWDREHRPSGFSRSKSQSDRQSDTVRQNPTSPTYAEAEAEAEAEEEEEEEKEEETTTTTPSPKETKSHKATSADRILAAWQKLPLPPEKKTFAVADVLAVERAISILAGDSQEPVHEGMILDAIENYHQALSLSDSQTYKHKLHPWLMEHIRKYVSYNFDIEHHRKSNFQKGDTQRQKLFPIAGKVCSQEGCGLPAVYKSSGGSYDHYYCNEHMPAKVKEKYT